MHDYPYKSIHINSREVALDDIINEAATGHSDFEKNTFHFIRQWLMGLEEFQVRTSGSTGPPKLISIKRAQMVASARLTEKALLLKKGYAALLCMDPEFIAGKMMLVRCFTSGMKIVAVEPSGNPLKKIDQAIDFVAVVPYQLYDMVRSPEAIKLNDFKTVIAGGAAIDRETEQMLGNFSCSFFATYGMTETISHVALKALNSNNAENLFETLPGVSIERDERGCLIAHAPFLTGPVITNDLVEIITPQTFKWLGRWDNVINTGGYKVVPEEVEGQIRDIFRHLNLHYPFIISGLPDAQLGKKVVLIIESNFMDDNKLEVLKQVMNQKLPKYKKPKEIFVISPFAFTKSGKIDRSVVEKLIQNFHKR